MNRLVEKLAAVGVPAIILIVAISASGLSGAAAITAGLAALGPGGMIGGIVFLAIAGIASEAITKYGFEAIFKAVLKELYKNGESKESIKNKIETYPITKSLKLKINNYIDELK